MMLRFTCFERELNGESVSKLRGTPFISRKELYAAMKKFSLPAIPADAATPWVQTLVAMIEVLAEENQRQAEAIQQMRDEIAVLKGEKSKPKFKSSKMDEETDKAKDDEAEDGEKQKRPGSAKSSKTAKLAIQEDRIISPGVPIPPGSRF